MVACTPLDWYLHTSDFSPEGELLGVLSEAWAASCPPSSAGGGDGGGGGGDGGGGGGDGGGAGGAAAGAGAPCPASRRMQHWTSMLSSHQHDLASILVAVTVFSLKAMPKVSPLGLDVCASQAATTPSTITVFTWLLGSLHLQFAPILTYLLRQPSLSHFLGGRAGGGSRAKGDLNPERAASFVQSPPFALCVGLWCTRMRSQSKPRGHWWPVW
mmetsp:Transcript_127753/g.409028  ORF Transcript_127753/g.409028 Transcript_127753/m.409028 type:complete len:214 (+) Transcript_127753:1561-2202(+)